MFHLQDFLAFQPLCFLGLPNARQTLNILRSISEKHFLLGINVNAKVESLVGAVPPENYFRSLLAVRRDLPHHHHLLPVVTAEADALELHHQGQGGVVDREL